MQNGNTSYQPIEILIPQAITQSAMDKTFSSLSKEIYYIGEENLGQLRHVELFITSLSQGHFCVGLRHDLDDPQSNIF